jgi:hypothetical protein
VGIGGEPAGPGNEHVGVDGDSDAGVGKLGVEELPTPSDASRWMYSTTKHWVVEVEGSGGGRRRGRR